jgi:galactokinase/mevalonate kinase-like predicted kinase
MIIIRKRAYARAALVGNPSDGYQGKTISLIVRNFWAEVVLYEWDTVDILLTEDDRARFRSVHDLARDVTLHGYYGGIRLIKATVKRFVDYCRVAGVTLHDRNFSIRYHTTIPRQVGLAGSSAIITATLRCLMEFYDVDIALDVQPSLVLSVERDELGVAAGLQDRVAQTYEGLTYMDFSRQHERIVHGLPCYRYEALDPALLPPLYVSYHQGFSEPTEVFHNDVRDRFLRGDAQVVGGMRRVAGLAASARDALVGRDVRQLSDLIDENFDVRRSIFNLPPWQVQMIDVARACGASANFAGSGGAVVGTYEGDAALDALHAALAAIACRVVTPEVS